MVVVDSCVGRVDARQHENLQRGTPMFPCGAYHSQVGGPKIDVIAWHWHEEIEVLMVCSGVLEVGLMGRKIRLETGEGIFINASVLHSAVHVGETPCEIKSFVFYPSLISGSLESIFEAQYVRPLTECAAITGVHFTNKADWHQDAVKHIQAAFVRYETAAFGYEFFVREHLSRLWYLIVSHYKDELEAHKNDKNIDALRVKEMLAFIHVRYAEAIELKDIAGAAAISSRECLRCFKRTLGITPMRYLVKHRISIAAELLTASSHTVTEIGRLTGFDSPSHFALAFKKWMKKTPTQYRKEKM